MGSANCLSAYHLYAGKVPFASLTVLGYMATVSLDRDREPCWWQGHEILAIMCFGRPEPIEDSDLRAVRRALTPLHRVGAITTIRHASGRRGRLVTVRYRLWLDQPAPDEKRPKPIVSIGRNVVEHRTVSGRTQDENRPPEEEEEEEEREEMMVPVVNTTLEVPPATRELSIDKPVLMMPIELAAWQAIRARRRQA